MNEINTYAKVLLIRNKFKALQQISWNISKFEKNINIDTATEEELQDLYEAYLSLVRDVGKLYDELKDEKSAHKTG